MPVGKWMLRQQAQDGQLSMAVHDLQLLKLGMFFFEKLKDRITPHVNFFQQAAKER
jgi:hypothetical protein